MRRPTAAALAAVVLLPAVAAVTASAAIVGGTPGPGLAQVGPVNATDGYPVWYKDKNGLRLERCVDLADPRCPARGAVPDETAPLSFPDNYPDESFYAMAAANLNTADAGKALVDIALEGAFAAGPPIDGDQIVFARLRIKITNARDGVDYRVTTPVGTKTVRTNKPGLVFDTEDIGIGGQGDFTGALAGRIGPFLTWSTFGDRSDPALSSDAYIGDGVTPHAVKGSPYGTNVFRIEGPGINPSAADACPTVGGPVSDCVETALFTVQGKVATTAGVTAERATYARSSGSAAVVDVFASSEPGDVQAIEVADATPGASAAFDPTDLPGAAGHYFARVAVGSLLPRQLQVSNVGDVPPSRRTVRVADRVSGEAVYDTGHRSLTVTAGSSDTADPPALTVTGWGAMTAGSLVVEDLPAPPPSVTVTSAAGGSLVLPVTVDGAARAPIPVVAQAGPDQVVQAGQTVRLDGSASRGPVATYAWTSPDGISVVDPDRAQASFTAPAVAGDYVLSLTVTGRSGSSTATLTVTVLPPAPEVVADAGPAQTVQRGTRVTLDGSRSVGAATYAWRQLAGPGDPVVTMTAADTARPSFTFPFFAYPAANGPLTFELTVRDVGATSTRTAQVAVTPTADVVRVTTARYTGGKWRVDGTSSVAAGQNVVAHLGSLAGPVVGRSVVDPTGAFSVRPATGPVATAGSVVVVESPLGGVSAPFTVALK